MKFFIPLLLFMFMFNSCEQSKEFIIKLDLRAATSNVYWQKCGTKIVFNGNVVGTYCNDDVDGSIFKFTDSTFNRKAYGFSLVTGQTDLVKKTYYSYTNSDFQMEGIKSDNRGNNI